MEKYLLYIKNEYTYTVGKTGGYHTQLVDIVITLLNSDQLIIKLSHIIKGQWYIKKATTTKRKIVHIYRYLQ
jgi:hypothetical protein